MTKKTFIKNFEKNNRINIKVFQKTLIMKRIKRKILEKQ